MIDKKKYRHIHFVGIKGVGMTALAVFAKEAGIKVTGSDTAEEFVTDEVLKRNGINPKVGFNEENIIDRPDLVIVTGAHGGLTNPEALAAKIKGIPVIMQGQAVGLFMEGKIGISVCGVGGKTTTSAMIATILTKAHRDPSFIIGCSEIFSLKNPGHFGKGEFCIAEADEYVTCPKIDTTPKFLWQTPTYIIVTNIDFDHPDVYKDIRQTRNTYLTFFNKLPQEGILIGNIDNQNVRETFSHFVGHKETYGVSKDATWRLKDSRISNGKTVFGIEHDTTVLGEITLPVPGHHNCLNALGAIVACLQLGLSFEEIKNGLSFFTGIKRRFEFKGERKNIKFYDDYAHHPNEIRTTLSTAREWFKHKKIICIFQAHTYSRTKALLGEFSQSFQKADEVFITDIYSSKREEVDPSVNGEVLASCIRKFQPNTYFLGSRKNVVEFMSKHLKPNSVVFTMGAGDIYKWGEEIMEHING